MTSGNHMVDGADKAYDDSFAKCSCGAYNWEELFVCEYDKDAVCVPEDCNNGGGYKKQGGCNSIIKTICSDCGFVLKE